MTVLRGLWGVGGSRMAKYGESRTVLGSAGVGRSRTDEVKESEGG